MPIYDYRCGCGRRFEVIQPVTAAAPPCPDCGGDSTKVPSAPALAGRASAGRSREFMPQTWRGTHDGNREHVTQLRREWAQRERLEAKHPELAGDTRPVLAHEGRYHAAPLRAGDAILRPGGGHGHSHDGAAGTRDTLST